MNPIPALLRPERLRRLHRLRSTWLSTLALGVASQLLAANLPRPIPDDVYLQEVGTQIPHRSPLTAVAVYQDRVFAGTERGLLALSDQNLLAVTLVAQPVERLIVAQNAAWAVTKPGLHRFADGVWKEITKEPVRDVCEHGGEVVVATDRKLWRVRNGALEAWSTAEAPFPIQRIQSFQENLFVLGRGRLVPFSGQQFGAKDVYDFPADFAWDWGNLPSNDTRDMLADGPSLTVATDRGLGVLRGMSMTQIRGVDGLCYEDTLCLTRGFTNDLWIGTSRGAIRRVGDSFHYFAGKRWLPSDRVNAIATGPDAVYAATDAGLAIIRFEPYTLLKKASYYERHLEEWGQKRLGFTHKLEWDAGKNEFVREMSDNDGGYTGDYLVAQAYRYAVTKDPEARREATNTFHALRWLEGMTGISGLPARAVWAKGETGHKAMHGSGGYDAEWHDCKDARFEWKGDTSSDELCSHFYAFNVFIDHAAQGQEVAMAKQHLARIADHLITNQWQLIDLDGKPTRWGRWDPDYFKTDEGHFDRGLQCLELLAFIKTAATLTPAPRYDDAYRKLIDLGYPGHMLRQRQTFPPEAVLHFEDELAWWSYWNLLRFEKNPALRAQYRRSFERTYEVIRVEKNPWFNYIYNVLTENPVELEASAQHLRDWPLDLRIWSYHNSHRADLRTPRGYVSLKGGIQAFPAREHEPMRWDAWTMKADGGANGQDVIEPGGWLAAYWMGRYHGFIAAPTTQDPALIRVEHSLNRELGAKPYSGPARPLGY